MAKTILNFHFVYLNPSLSLVGSYALVMFGCLLVQIRIHMNLYTSLHNECLWHDKLWEPSQ